ncbi:molybdenum cofactor guanylyltransferase [Pseudonocardiaceae bacterium YIM PH 21723]|nr:molybdenum cofactor guanylyltransferase [Pseudonocardiaceae bacterium YIM PH 21723]
MNAGRGTLTRFSAVILAGGAGIRLGGVDKAAVELDGRSLLSRALAAVQGAEQVVVVGPERDGFAVDWACEDPPGGGPAAALAAGVERLSGVTTTVMALAVDHPGVGQATVERLIRALWADSQAAGALLMDDGDARTTQWLVSAWRYPALRAALSGEMTGRALRRVLGGLPMISVAATGAESADVDTPADLADWQARLTTDM